MERHNSEVTVGRWRLLRPLGAGGFAEVFAAVDGDGNVASVKCLRPPGSPNRGVTGRMRAEVRALELVSGRTPHLPLIVEADLDADPPFIAMELLNGPTAAAHIAQHGPVTDPATLMSVAAALALALRELHDLELVHRDVKPSNVIFVPGRGAVLIDLGIALGPDWTRNTGGGVVGTAGYVPHEVYKGKEATPASDVFAWAATLVELASGTKVYGTSFEVMAQRVLDDRPEIGDALDGLPQRFAELLRAGLSPDPASRPSVTEALDLIAQLRAHLASAAARPASSLQPNRRTPEQVRDMLNRYRQKPAAGNEGPTTGVVGGEGGTAVYQPAPTSMWLEVRARTVEDAKVEILEVLGLAPDQAEFEVLEHSTPGPFGTVRGTARVRGRARRLLAELPVHMSPLDSVTGRHGFEPGTPRALRRRRRELASMMRSLLAQRCDEAARELSTSMQALATTPVADREARAGRAAQLATELRQAAEVLSRRSTL